MNSLRLFATCLFVFMIVIELPSLATGADGTRIDEPSRPFLEEITAGRTAGIGATWSWRSLDGQRYAYEICVQTPDDWREAYLCIDGDRAKTVSAQQKCFAWTFHALAVGTHRITLVVLGDGDRFGLVERELRIK